MPSCQEKLQEKLIPSFPPTLQSPPPSPLRGSCQVSPGMAPEAGTLKESASGHGGDPAPGSRTSLSQPLDPGPPLHGYGYAHTLCTRTSRLDRKEGTKARGYGRPGREQQDPPSSRQQPLSSVSLLRVLSTAPHSSLSMAAPKPRARTNGITVSPVPSPVRREGGKEGGGPRAP